MITTELKDRWLISEQVETLLGSKKAWGLAELAKVPEEIAIAWLNGRDPVPQDHQATVEAWLDPSKGMTLFTDVNPKRQDNDTDPNK